MLPYVLKDVTVENVLLVGDINEEYEARTYDVDKNYESENMETWLEGFDSEDLTKYIISLSLNPNLSLTHFAKTDRPPHRRSVRKKHFKKTDYAQFLFPATNRKNAKP